MLVLVTGAAGHIGGNLTRALLDAGHKVRVLVHREDRAVRGLPVERMEGDVCDEAVVRKAVAGAEVVFHLAARISITGDRDGSVRRTNVLGPRTVAQACLDAGVRRMVHFSSIHAFSPHPLEQPIDEARAPTDGNGVRAPAYDASKAAGEREVLAAVARGLDAVILNPAGVLGPHDYGPSRMGEVLLMLHQRRIPMVLDGGFNWVDVRDVVRVALAAVDKGRRGERYLLAGHWVSIAGLAALVESITGVKAPRLRSPMWLARVGAPFVTAFSRVTGQRPLYTSEALHALRGYRHVCDDKARRELGHDPRPIRDTVAATLEWFQQSGRA